MATDKLLAQGIAAAQAGRQVEARATLLKVLQADGHNETAWLWLSGLTEKPAERRYCLEHVLAINPTNVHARRGLALLNNAAQSKPQPTGAPQGNPPAKPVVPPPSQTMQPQAAPTPPAADPNSTIIGPNNAAIQAWRDQRAPEPAPAPKPGPAPALPATLGIPDTLTVPIRDGDLPWLTATEHAPLDKAAPVAQFAQPDPYPDYIVPTVPAHTPTSASLFGSVALAPVPPPADLPSTLSMELGHVLHEAVLSSDLVPQPTPPPPLVPDTSASSAASLPSIEGSGQVAPTAPTNEDRSWLEPINLAMQAAAPVAPTNHNGATPRPVQATPAHNPAIPESLSFISGVGDLSWLEPTSPPPTPVAVEASLASAAAPPAGPASLVLPDLVGESDAPWLTVTDTAPAPVEPWVDDAPVDEEAVAAIAALVSAPAPTPEPAPPPPPPPPEPAPPLAPATSETAQYEPQCAEPSPPSPADLPWPLRKLAAIVAAAEADQTPDVPTSLHAPPPPKPTLAVPKEAVISAETEEPCPFCGAPTLLTKTVCPCCQHSLIVRGNPPARRSVPLLILVALYALSSLAALGGGISLIMSVVGLVMGASQLGIEVPIAPVVGLVIAVLAGVGTLIWLTLGLLQRKRGAFIAHCVMLGFNLLAALAMIGLSVTGGAFLIELASSFGPDGVAAAEGLVAAIGMAILLNVLLLAGITALTLMSRNDFYGPMVRLSVAGMAVGENAYNAGLLYRNSGMWFMAALAWEQAAIANPGDLRTRRALGLAYAQLKHYDLARETIQTALTLAPEEAQLREDLQLIEQMAAREGKIGQNKPTVSPNSSISS